jgi:hypothetical protein
MSAPSKPLALLFTLLLSARAFAVSEHTDLYPDNLQKQDGFLFTVTAQTDGDMILYTLTINPRPGQSLPPLTRGTLSLMDGKQPITTCNLARTPTKTGLTYTFHLAPKYLPTSTFIFALMAGTPDYPMPAGDFYTLHLADFPARKK